MTDAVRGLQDHKNHCQQRIDLPVNRNMDLVTSIYSLTFYNETTAMKMRRHQI